MLAVIRSYAPFLIWLSCALIALFSAHAGAMEPPQIAAQVQAARRLLHDERWRDAARLELLPSGSTLWQDKAEAEIELVFIRGVGAARAGCLGVARESIERLEGIRIRLDAAGRHDLADDAKESQWIIETALSENRGS